MTAVKTTAHSCGDLSTAQESALSPACLIQYVRSNGGFVHPDLQLLFGDEAEHGQLSLTGVPANELSLVVPDSVSETTKKPGPWMRFQESLGRVIDAAFVRTHGVGNSIYPLFDAANHGPNGRMQILKGRVELYGCEWIYSTNKALLKAVWGIVDG